MGEHTYKLTTRENGRLVSETEEADPFVNHRVMVRGWRNAWRVFRRRYELTVEIDADRALVERVLELNPDYLGSAGSPSRETWNAELNQSIRAFIQEPEGQTRILQLEPERGLGDTDG